MRKISIISIFVLFCGICSAQYVDLGLPSGTKWKSKNQSGFWDHQTALNQFEKNLPSNYDWNELKAYCDWEWDGTGYKITGPNGNSIILPAAGKSDGSQKGYYGEYISCTNKYEPPKTIFENGGTTQYFYFYFNSDNMTSDSYFWSKYAELKEMSVRLIQKP